MRNLFFCLLVIVLSSCCKYRVTAAGITFRFEGFDPSMSHVTVVNIRNYGYIDSVRLTLDGNKQAFYQLPFYDSDSIYLSGLIPSGIIGLSSVNTSILSDGSGRCGGPADEGQVSFKYRDSVYPAASLHFVRIRP